VVLADGTRAKEEDALMRLVANLLGISDRDSAIARQKVNE
ncbi:MAG: TerB family tellurite resistance protein, partial [Paracoccaceae bacterium]